MDVACELLRPSGTGGSENERSIGVALGLVQSTRVIFGFDDAVDCDIDLTEADDLAIRDAGASDETKPVSLRKIALAAEEFQRTAWV